MTIRAAQESVFTLCVRVRPAATDASHIATRLDVTFMEGSTHSAKLGLAPGGTRPLWRPAGKTSPPACEEGLACEVSPIFEEFLQALGKYLVQLRPELGEFPAPAVAARQATPLPAQTMPTSTELASSFQLTRREQEVLEHVLAGHLNKQTAFALMISPRTVEHYRAAAMLKIGAQSSADIRMTAHARRTEKAL
jgi:DNA-binding CsgD family transcriptional regulator